MDYIHVTLGVFLFILGIEDIRTKKISSWICILGAIFILVGICIIPEKNILDRVVGFLLGASIIGVSKITKGKIGMGDGMILAVTGMGLGFWVNMELFAIALLFAAIVSIILLIFKKVNKKQAIPFVPFLFLGYGFIMFINL